VTATPEPDSSTIVEERPDVRTSEGGDHDKFAHYVKKEKLNEALVMGTPVRALCGKLWTPFGDPSKYPVCPDCKRIWESFRDEPGDPDR
jgi:hypothetical protein